jgi:hypothetical protein
MIELTEQQSRALRDNPAEAINVRDPETGKTYRLTETTSVDYQLPEAVLESMRAYWLELPKLLDDRKLRGKWVLYRGNERVAVGKDMGELYRLAEARGFSAQTYFIERIDPQPIPPWEPDEEEVEGGIIEFDDDDDVKP